MPKESQSIFVLLAGQTVKGLPDPILSLDAIKETKRLRDSGALPPATHIICGTGMRHFMTATIAEITPDLYSPICGTPAIQITGASGNNYFFLANQVPIPTVKWKAPDIGYFLRTCPPNTLLVADIEFMDGLGIQGSLPGMMYQLDFEEDSGMTISILYMPHIRKKVR